jgi:hypothetical protein
MLFAVRVPFPEWMPFVMLGAGNSIHPGNGLQVHALARSSTKSFDQPHHESSHAGGVGPRKQTHRKGERRWERQASSTRR